MSLFSSLSHCCHKPSVMSRCSSRTGKAAEKPTGSRKRKGLLLPEPGTAKRHAHSSHQQPAQSAEDLEQEAVGTSADAAGYKFEVSTYHSSHLTVDRTLCQCDRCVTAGVVCEPDPIRPCSRCVNKKQRCSLMPFNEKTGKTDRKKATEVE